VARYMYTVWEIRINKGLAVLACLFRSPEKLQRTDQGPIMSREGSSHRGTIPHNELCFYSFFFCL